VFAVPMVVLYLIGIGVSSVVTWRRSVAAARRAEAGR